MKSASETIQSLGLIPHPEGGWYKELYRSSVKVSAPQGQRLALTAIYFLLAHGQQSRWHMVPSDEAWNFYAGDPLALLAYDPASGKLIRHVLGAPGSVAPKSAASLGPKAEPVAPIAVIPAGWWQTAWPLGEYGLVGCEVGPGFEFEDFRFVADLPDYRRHFSGELAAFSGLL